MSGEHFMNAKEFLDIIKDFHEVAPCGNLKWFYNNDYTDEEYIWLKTQCIGSVYCYDYKYYFELEKDMALYLLTWKDKK